MLSLLCDVRDISILLSISLFADDVCHSIIRSTIDRGYNRYLLLTLLFLSPSLSSSRFFSSLSLSPLTLSFPFYLFLLSHTLLHALSLLSLVCNLSFPSPSLLQIPLTSAFYSITIDFQVYGIKELKKCELRRTNQEVYLPSTPK